MTKKSDNTYITYDSQTLATVLGNRIANMSITSYGPKAINLSAKMSNIIINTMIKHNKKVELDSKLNMGEAMEGLITAILEGHEVGRSKKSGKADLSNKRYDIDIKVSTNAKDTASVLSSPIQVLLITTTGAYTITKATMTKLFATPEEFKKFVKIEPTGLRLKPTASELGRLNKKFTDLLGF
jgi:hypothetical protein